MEPHNNDDLKRSALSGVVWKFAERIFARLVSLTVSIVLARLLFPEDYSVISIVSIFFAFCSIFISGGLNSALVQKKNADAKDYSTVLYMNLTMAAVLYTLMFLLAPFIAQIYEKPQLTAVVRVMSLTFFANAVKSVLSAYMSSTLNFKRFFLATMGGTIISAVVGISMAYKGMGVWALVAQEMTNTVIDTIVLYFTAKIKFVRTLSAERMKALFGYGGKIMMTSVISTIYDQLSPLIVGLRFTTVDLAYYNKGNSFPEIINRTISDTMSSVLFPIMAKVQDDREDVLNITRRYIKVSSYIIFPVMMGLLSVSENFVRVLLTDKWLPVVPYIRIFSLNYMLNLIQIGNLQAIKAIGRSDILLRLEILKKSLYFALIAAFVFLSDDPQTFALSSICCTVVATLINTSPNRKLLGYQYRKQLADVLPNLTIALVMAAIVLAMGELPISAYLLLSLQILAGVLIYVGLSVVTHNENFRYMLEFLKKFAKKG